KTLYRVKRVRKRSFVLIFPIRTSWSIWANGTKNVPLASASGALVLIGFLFHDKREPSRLRCLAGFSSIKKTLWRLAGLFLDQENSLASGGPFPRSRKLSGVWQAFSSIKKTS